MVFRKLPACLILLASAACGPVLSTTPEPGRQVDDATRESVKTVLFERLVLTKAEAGPRFTDALPEIQDAVATEAGFKDWEEYLLCLRATEPGADLALTNEITERIAALLAATDPIENPR